MFRFSVGMAVAAFAINASAATTSLLSENFDDMDATAAKIPGWKAFDQAYNEAGCKTKIEGGEVYDLDNRNYTTADTSQGGDGNYFRAGLEAGGDNRIGDTGSSLRVYENTAYGNADAACTQVLVFKEFANGTFVTGEHTFKVKMMNQKYVTNSAGSVQGMFAKVLDVNNSYDEVLAELKPITPPDTATEQTLTFTVPSVANGILQIGFYAQGNGGRVASGAVWDDISVTYEKADDGGGDNDGGADTPAAPSVPVPVMPLGGLLGLIALVGWLGLRRRG